MNMALTKRDENWSLVSRLLVSHPVEWMFLNTSLDVYLRVFKHHTEK